MKDVTSTINLMAAIAGILSTIITVIQFIRIKKKNRLLEKEVRNIASTGVAIGYYYNFAKDIFLILKAARLKVEIYKSRSNEVEEVREFETDKVKLRVIIPENLTAEALDHSISKMNSYKKGDIVRIDTERHIGINLEITEDNTLLITDFPKPLKAVRMHLLNEDEFKEPLRDGKFQSEEDLFHSERWKEVEKEEIENFKKTVIHLIKRDDVGVPISKIEFVLVGQI